MQKDKQIIKNIFFCLMIVAVVIGLIIFSSRFARRRMPPFGFAAREARWLSDCKVISFF